MQQTIVLTKELEMNTGVTHEWQILRSNTNQCQLLYGDVSKNVESFRRHSRAGLEQEVTNTFTI